MQIAQVMGGYSLGGADLLRRAMGKKKVEEMAQQRDIFVAGAIKNGMTEQNAITLFNLMEKFAGYGFNKSHAAAYALIAFQTAYLKTHYPAEFMAACLSAEMNDTDKINVFYEDCQANYLTVLPPDINLSEYRFVPVDNRTIRYGLGAVKGTGEGAISTIIEARNQDGGFTDLFDFCYRVDRRVVNRRVIESLIRVGAFDSIDPNRAGLFASVGMAIEFAEQRSLSTHQASLFGEAENSLHHPALVIVPPWSDKDMLQNEKLGLGFYISGHPYFSYAKELQQFVRTRLDRLSPQREHQLIAGVIHSVRTQMTRRGKMAIIVLDDGHARVEVVVYNELFRANSNWLKEDQLLIAEATVGQSMGNTGELRITAEKLYDLASARSYYAKKMRFQINGSIASGMANVARLKELLAPYQHEGVARNKGAEAHTYSYCPVTVIYQNQRAICEIELGEVWRVHLGDALIESLQAGLKVENIEIVY